MDLNKLVFSNKENLQKFNTITKYPSIATYHEIDKGKLKTNLTPNSFADDEYVFITEKIDGTNSRIIYYNGDFIIGSRESLLYAKGDRIGDPAQRIVETVKPVTKAFDYFDVAKHLSPNTIYVFYGESYGGKITGASRQYTVNENLTNFRLFDVAKISLEEIIDLIEQPIEKLALWREGSGDGHDKFMDVNAVNAFANHLNIRAVPIRKRCTADYIPKTLEEVYEWLANYNLSVATIDEDHNGLAEGVVVRNFDRSIIRKIRFQDYERTLGLKKTR